ncbi:hypothetical protein HELRODRAFT_91778, partial [Helobdella robusta]|uniref:Major facilitator superfamily (MFS) profile domain-containing protein n=1 Tax=Helobdella robusta TaxID=6412 RepID=T1G887_HELRO
KMSRKKLFTVITFCIANFFNGLFYSILAPFFPTEAQKKEISSTQVGLVFGSFELVLIIVSPFYGNYLNKIGAKFMYITGIFVCGVCSILFGIIDKAPNGTPYFVLCLIVRMFEGLGAAAFGTASFAIMAYNFPKHIATMFGTLEMFTGLGLMAGPPIGGALYELGGFASPFATLGSFILVIGLISIFMLSPYRVNDLPRKDSVFKLLKYPVITLTCLCLLAGSCSMGYLDVSLSVHLTKSFHLSPFWVGLVFLVEPLAYSIMSPIWGRIVEYKPKMSLYIISFGYVMAGLSLFFIGPAPFFNIQSNLVLLILCLIFGGLGISTLTITFQIITETTIAKGYPDTLSTYGLISGLVNSFFSLGFFHNFFSHNI